jgi:outer membrane immunogenic protein
MNKHVLLTTAAILVAGSASAADLGTRMPMAPAPYAQPTWGGLYIGAFTGVAYSSPTVYGGDPGETYISDLGIHNSKFSGMLGGAVGYNWQSGAFVYGLEGDIAGVFGGKSCSDYSDGCAYSSTRTNYIATIRGRAGFAFDRALIYLTAGYAGVGTKDGYNDCVGCGAFSAPGTVKSYHNGMALGGGVEFAVSQNWSVKVEGLQILTERKSGSASANGYDYKIASKANQTLLKFGLNYRM